MRMRAVITYVGLTTAVVMSGTAQAQVSKTLIALTAIGLLALPALWRERDKWIGSSGQKTAGA